MLEACAASYSAPVAGACFAPGVLEVAWVLGCERHAHVAALAAPFCRVEAAMERGAGCHVGALRLRRSDAGAEPRRGRRRKRVAASSAERTACGSGPTRAPSREAAALFRRARLHLLALDCEPCAIASLADALGTGDPDGARRQHLSAVAVLPESESAAEALGDDLAVPVGLAVAWFGGRRAL